MSDHTGTRADLVERAYRLAFPGVQPPWRPYPTAGLAWKDTTAILHTDPQTTRESALNHAILALALLPEGGGTLGRWTVDSERRRLREGGGTVASLHEETWLVDLAPGSYLDGTAQELLLLMAAADELARREVQPCT